MVGFGFYRTEIVSVENNRNEKIETENRIEIVFDFSKLNRVQVGSIVGFNRKSNGINSSCSMDSGYRLTVQIAIAGSSKIA